MSFAGPNFVIAIVVVMTVGWLINNWIRAKHGYPLEDEWGGKSDDGDELPDGTYYFIIDRNNGETKTGWIYINRAQ